MNSIDNRIVQMQFENSQFEKGAKESIKTIEELDKKLEFSKAKKNIEDLQKAGDRFSLAKIANSLEIVANRFTVMGQIGGRVLENLTDRAVAFAEKYVKMFSVDQISAGWQKYADKTTSVQTIVNATGLSIEEVNKQLEKLQWFTDETSYNFVDMVSNIGKFTSMNVPLDKSVTAMQGIATWAAVSGRGTAEASRAMYNLSQAMGVGAVKLIDWKSIENANMATAEFKQTAIDTAVAMGTLKKGEVSLKTFNSTLAKGWFTSDVLMKVLEQYGSYADEVYEVSEHGAIPAAQAMDKLGKSTNALGEKAFKAAQEAKTLKEAIEATTDAVSSGWMETFEIIFGNYVEAKELWTDLANALWEVFASGGAARNELLATWKELGGREDLLKGVYDIFHALYGVLLAVKDAIADIFPPITVEQVLAVSTAVKDFGANLKQALWYVDSTSEKLRRLTGEEKKASKSISVFTGELKFGDKSEEVKELQKALKKLGYLKDSAADGIYGPKTKTAVEEFQKAKGIVEDGIFNEKTFRALEEEGYEAGMRYTEAIGKGDKGATVKRIQERLIESGYLDAGQADGIFGPKTKKALIEFQKAQHLTASGIVNEKTFTRLFPETEKQAKGFEWVSETVYTYGASLQNLQTIVKGAASIASIFLQTMRFVGNVAGHVLTLLAPLGQAFLVLVGAVASAITKFDKWLQTSGLFDRWFSNFKSWIEPFGKWVKNASDNLLAFFGFGPKAKEAAQSGLTFKKIFDTVISSVKKSGVIKKVSKAFNKLHVSLSKLTDKIKGYWGIFKKAFGAKFTEFTANIPNIVDTISKSIGDFVESGLDLFSKFIDKIPNAIKSVKDFFSLIFNGGVDANGNKVNVLDVIKEKLKGVYDYLFGVEDAASKKSNGLFPKLGAWIQSNVDAILQSLPEDVRKDIYSKIEGVKTFFKNVGNLFSKVKQIVLYVFTGNMDFLPKGESRISDETIKKLDTFRSDVGAIFKWLADSFVSIKDAVKDVFKNGIDLSSWDSIKDGITKIWDAITGAISQFDKGLSDDAKHLFNFLDKAILFGGIVFLLWKFFKSLFGILRDFNGILRLISGSFSDLGEAFKENLKQRKKENFYKTILAFAASIALIAGSIWVLSQLNIDQITQGGIAVAAIATVLGGFMVAAKFLGKGASGKAINRVAKAMLDISLSVAILAGTTVILGLIPWNLFLIGAAKLVILSGIMVGIIAGLNALGATRLKLAGLVGLAGAIAILTGVIWMIGHMRWETIGKGLAGLLGIMTILGAFMFVLGKVGGTNVRLKGFFALSIAIAVLTGIVAILGHMRLGTMIKGFLGLFVIVSMLKNLMATLALVGTQNVKIAPILGVAVVIAALSYVAWQLGHTDLTTLIKGIAGMWIICKSVTAVLKTLGEADIDLKKSAAFLVAMLSLGMIMAAFTGMAYAMKYIDFGSFAQALIGMIAVSAVMIKLTKSLDDISTDFKKTGNLLLTVLALSLVMAAFTGMAYAMTFVDFGSFIKALVGMIAVSAVMIKLTKSLDDISTDFKKTGNLLLTVVALGLAMAAFTAMAYAMKGVDFGSFVKALGGLISVAVVMTKVTKSIGNSSIDFKKAGSFIIAAAAIAGAMYVFSLAIEKVKNVDPLVIGAFSAGFSAVMLAMAAVGKIAGANPVGSMLGILAVAGALAVVIGAVLGILHIPGVEEFLSGGMEKLGKIIGSFTGSMKAAEVGAFAKGVDSLSDIGEVDTGKLDSALAAAEKISDFSKSLSSGNIAVDVIRQAANAMLGSALEQFSESMVGFGSGIAMLGSQLDTVEDYDSFDKNVDSAITIATKIKEFADSLKSEDGWIADVIQQAANFALGSPLKQFGESMVGFASGYLAFTQEINQVGDTSGLDTKTTQAIEIATKIKAFADSLKSEDGWIADVIQQAANFALGSPLKQFGESMAGFASGYLAFTQEINQVGDTSGLDSKTDKAIKIATKVKTFADSLKSEDGWVADVLERAADAAFGSKLENFGKSMVGFASGINEYSREMLGIVYDQKTVEKKTTSAISIAEKVKKFADSLNEKTLPEKIAEQWLGVDSEFSSFCKDMEGFGSSFNKFSTELGQITYGDEEKTAFQNALDVSGQVADFISSLASMNIDKNKGVIQGLFTENTSQNTVFDSLGQLGQSLGNAKTDFADVDKDLVDKVSLGIPVLKAFARLLNYLGKNKDTLLESHDGFAIVRELLFESGYGIIDTLRDAATQLGDVDLQPLGNTVGGIATLFVTLTDNADLLRTNLKTSFNADEIVAAITTFDASVTSSIDTVVSNMSERSNSLGEVGTSFGNSFFSGMSGADGSQAIDSMVESIGGKTGAFTDVGKKFGDAIGNALAMGDTTGAATLALNLVKKANSKYADFVSVGKNFVMGLASGIKESTWLAKEAAQKAANEVYRAAKEELQVSSPSRKAAELGRYFSLGMAQGIDDSESEAIGSSKDLAAALLSTAKGGMSSLASMLADDMDDTPVISPVVDLTRAREAANSIGSMFGTQSFAVETRNLASRAMTARENRYAENQNGSRPANQYTTVDSGVTISGNTFYIRSEQDIYELGNEISNITRREQRNYGNPITI